MGTKLGHPFRSWKVFLEPSFSSVMIWEIWTHILFIFLLLGMLYAAIKNKDVLLKRLSYISVPIGIAFISLVGALFGVVAARPFWNVSVMPLMFFIASIVAGVALLILIHLLFSPTKGTEAYTKTAENLSRVFIGAISIGIIAALGNALIIAFPNVPAYNEALNLVLFGPYWWTTWIIHIGIGIVIPLILLFFYGKNLKAMGAAAVCYLIGFSMVPVNIIIPGLAYPMSGMEGIEEAFHHAKLSFEYTPALVEWLVVIFAVGLALFIFTLGYKYILQPYFERTWKQ
ncbi:MAG: NrfD/PsrC family molybdoenzyme membrane anchor subunit [Balneolaceae bacterium]|nr:NrfD/PsrC family molybdoenzyme membrane anchor subunit [Balneolaceae bacterium]